MNKLLSVFFMFALVSLAACNGRLIGGKADMAQADSDSLNNSDYEMDEISPEATVDYYYSAIVRRYMEEHATSAQNFEEFYSTDFRKLLKAVWRRERIYHENGPVDWDIWINAKTFDNLSVKTVDRYVTEDSTTMVEVTLRNTGSENKIYVELVNENGLWMVDNFRYPGEKGMVNLRPLLEEYIAGGGQKTKKAKAKRPLEKETKYKI